MLLEVYLKLNKIERLIHKENLETARLYGPLSDISHGQGRILAYLKTKEPLSVKELAELMEIRPQSLNDHLRRMQRDGLIIREPSPEDKRKVLISLTPKARDLDISYKSYETIFEGLTEEEIEELNILLSKIENNLKSELGDDILDEPRPGEHPEPPHLRGPKILRGPGHRPVPPHLRGSEGHPEPPRDSKELPPHLSRPIEHPNFIESPEERPFEPYGPESRPLKPETEVMSEVELKDFVVSVVEEMLDSFKQEGLELKEAETEEVNLNIDENSNKV